MKHRSKITITAAALVIGGISGIGGSVPLAHANEAVGEPPEAVREAVICRPVKPIVKHLRKITDIPAENRTLVDTVISLQLKALDGGDMPERLFVKTSDQEKTLTLDEAGYVEDFMSLSAQGEDAVFCIQDPARAGTSRSKPGLNINMSTVTKYISASGRHSLEDLLIGAQQGKTHYKKTFGGGVKNAFIPSIDHVLVSPLGGMELPKISVVGENGPVDIKIEETSYGAKRFHVMSVKEMKKAGAQALLITGGYELKPVPSVKKLRKFGMID